MFYVRIISPSGSTLSVQDQGSGVLTAVETGEQVTYTTTASANYNQTKQNVCSHWNQSTGFQPGKYIAEIYQDGYLVGKKDLELK